MKTKRPEVAAIYCPLWHTYDHACSWKGEGWCEWELLKSATPRFDGHYQPYKPEWGCFDESDPAWAGREIDLAADHGIDVFIFDWYWYSGVRIMEEALEKGFLKAPNRKRLKFALMWANHDWKDYFPPPFGKDWNSWLPMRHTPRDLDRVIDYGIEHYLREPNYWTVEGRLFFSIFEPMRMIGQLGGAKLTRAALKAIDRKLAAAGLPAMHWNAMAWGAEHADTFREAGFASTTTYNVTGAGTAGDGLREEYSAVMGAHEKTWSAMAAASLPHAPVVTMGWDVTPRCEKDLPWPFPVDPRTGNHGYPYGHIVEGNTPERFGDLCARARQHVEDTRPQPYSVFVNAWNEWTEGSFLLPEKRYGNGYLEALKKAFRT